jgi:serine protease
MAQPKHGMHKVWTRGQQSDRLIIKLKTNNRFQTSSQINQYITKLGNKVGERFSRIRRTGNGAQVMRLPKRRSLDDLWSMAKIIAQDPQVAYVEPDVMLQPMFVPDDSRYNEQWDFFEATGGINMPAAWDVTSGEGVVVAVVDTGYRPHVDLAANILPGYDMISDTTVSNDGDGRDADASDPGDAVAANECGLGSSAHDSSWHGTHVAGTIAAVTNNSTGVAGIAYNAKIVPVRVLGKCGGYLSDIADGVMWAAGVAVTGTTPNANPAKVINLSLGGQSTCSTAMQDAIDQARDAGATVVVAAGNSNADAVDFTPASCNGVVTVAATDRNGAKAPYSNFGSVVDVAAPGGDATVSSADAILSTLNDGATGPGNDIYAFYQGTSMATPHVTGLGALLYSVNPNLTPDEVEYLITSSARAFPGTCTDCGSGIIDAGAAVQLAASASLPLTNGTPSTGLSATAGDELQYFIDVPEGVTDLTFSISGGTGNADIYVKYGAQPTVTDWDYRPLLAGNDETVTIATPAAGIYYIMVQAAENFSDVTLSADYTETPPVVGTTFENTWNYPIYDFGYTFSPIYVTHAGVSGTIQVGVDIKHTYIGDLVITLVAPNGTAYRLKNPSLDPTDNLLTTYTVDAGLVQSTGLWYLVVYDVALFDTGYLDSWNITFP